MEANEQTFMAMSAMCEGVAGARGEREEVVEVTKTIKRDYPKAFRAARKDRMRIVWLEDDLVYVARRARGHGQYLVRFFITQRVGGNAQVKINCNSVTGGPCDGTKWKGFCSHQAAALLRGQAKITQKEKKAA